MRVFIANFGRENYEWPVCRERGTVATMNDLPRQALWGAGDKEGYVAYSMTEAFTARGERPTRAVASRWFNLMTIVSETEGDLWIHRDGEQLWWTISTAEPPEYEQKVEKVARGAEVMVCHKPCQPWSDRSRGGVDLKWRSLHPKARDFLSTEATLQQLSSDYATYARALIEGDDLDPWHSLPLWRAKNERASSKHGEVRTHDAKQRVAYRAAYEAFDAVKRMADTALATTRRANGQLEERRVKQKEMRFPSAANLQDHVQSLIDRQEGRCELTGLPFDYDEPHGDSAFFASLDRIDSDSHYEAGNLQVVCRFVNRWKGAEDDGEFRRLLAVVREER